MVTLLSRRSIWFELLKFFIICQSYFYFAFHWISICVQMLALTLHLAVHKKAEEQCFVNGSNSLHAGSLQFTVFLCKIKITNKKEEEKMSAIET